MKNLIAKIVGILTLTWGGMSIVQATPTPATVTVCTDIEVKTCKVAALPAKAGHVIHIVRGNWVSPVTATASWIAGTNGEA
ncbi:hypothetical protein [Massilia soli]|uniref:Uncharacterized protein n=1 Tax=Massilia soli TaxID=2792854 RepID=A0ABS7SPV3_9BURK|nr:hypothetical protein [Massilia soli]MBZ2208221.1 hypothetical protein [Massilia soli]